MWRPNRDEMEIAALAHLSASDELDADVLAELRRRLMSRRPEPPPAARWEQPPAAPEAAPGPER